ESFGPHAKGMLGNVILRNSAMDEHHQALSKAFILVEENVDVTGMTLLLVFLLYTADPAISKGNNCLDAAKACNLNDTCKKLRSAYITPCTSSVSNEVCNKRKCHKALRQFFDKVPPKHSYGMLFCSCRDVACTERRRQTIVPVCSYEDREKPNCLNLQDTCKTNYICRAKQSFRSRLADFIANCQPETQSISSCLKENYADCLLAYSGLIGTVMTPNYLNYNSLSVAPWCDCSNSGNDLEECLKFLNFFQDNICLKNAIQAFGNGTDVNVWQPLVPVQTTTALTTTAYRSKSLGSENTNNEIPTNNDLPACANLKLLPTAPFLSQKKVPSQAFAQLQEEEQEREAREMGVGQLPRPGEGHKEEGEVKDWAMAGQAGYLLPLPAVRGKSMAAAQQLALRRSWRRHRSRSPTPTPPQPVQPRTRRGSFSLRKVVIRILYSRKCQPADRIMSGNAGNSEDQCKSSLTCLDCRTQNSQSMALLDGYSGKCSPNASEGYQDGKGSIKAKYWSPCSLSETGRQCENTGREKRRFVAKKSISFNKNTMKMAQGK
ncbi:GDNF family receptor alpha-1, partial [Varanus komodoensis]